jgi:hypothetical protein
MNSSTDETTQVAGQAAIPDSINQRWLSALRSDQPGLPKPVAEAMVDGAAKGPLGGQLRTIEGALLHLEKTNLQDLTGSELRVVMAVLGEMHDTLAQLESQLKHLWERE